MRAPAPVGLVALLALASTACTVDREPPPPEATLTRTDDGSDAARPRAGGTLRVLLASDVDSLDPHYAARPSSWWFARAVHRGLYAFPDLAMPEGADPVPDLAIALPDFSDGGRTATIQLREGIRFSDEQLVDARAVRASLLRLLGARVGIAPHLVARRGVPGGIAGIDVVDARTIRIHLGSASNDLAWMLAHPQAAILPADLPRAPASPRAIAGAGPYMLAGYSPERSIVLRRAPTWDRATDPVRAASLDRIEARLGVDAGEARADIASGRAHLIVDPGPPDAPLGRAMPGTRVEDIEPGCVRYLFLDARSSPFEQLSVRRAVAHALDRAAIPGARPAVRLLPPTVAGSSARAVLVEDLGRARALLDGRSISATITVGDSPRDRREALAVRNALARADIHLSVRTVPAASLYPLSYEDPSERVQMGIATWCAEWPGRGGRALLVPLAQPSWIGEQAVPARPGVPGTSAGLARAMRSGGERVAAAWADADADVVGSAILIPLSHPFEQLTLAPAVRGRPGSPMFPRGDPTRLWLDARAEG